MKRKWIKKVMITVVALIGLMLIYASIIVIRNEKGIIPVDGANKRKASSFDRILTTIYSSTKIFI